MKNILLLIHDDAGQEARYQAALDITRAVGGHLTCVDVVAIPEYVGDYVGERGMLIADEQADEAANKTRMLARLAQEDVTFDWIDRTAFLANAILDHAGLADLIVLSSDDKGVIFPHMPDLIGQLAIALGKPILVVPPAATGFRVQGQALVAWDGSPHAEAALQAALPLLRHAANVTLFHAEDGSLLLPIEDAARYLARHDIEPVIKRIPIGAARPGGAILAEADGGGHDWVVMGAYSRSPTIESIFGGATRTMLVKSTRPLLIVHRR